MHNHCCYWADSELEKKQVTMCFLIFINQYHGNFLFQIYGKGANPIYKLATRHGLVTTPNDKRDVVYFDSYGPVPTQVGHELTDTFEQVMEDMVLYAGITLIIRL